MTVLAQFVNSRRLGSRLQAIQAAGVRKLRSAGRHPPVRTGTSYELP